MSKKELIKKMVILDVLTLIAIIISTDLVIKDRYHTASIILIVSNMMLNISGLTYLKNIQSKMKSDTKQNYLISYHLIYVMTTIAPLLEIIRIYNIFN